MREVWTEHDKLVVGSLFLIIIILTILLVFSAKADGPQRVYKDYRGGVAIAVDSDVIQNDGAITKRYDVYTISPRLLYCAEPTKRVVVRVSREGGVGVECVE